LSKRRLDQEREVRQVATCREVAFTTGDEDGLVRIIRCNSLRFGFIFKR